jgi:hypothetical protein
MHRFALAIFNGPAMMAAIKTHTHTRIENIWNAQQQARHTLFYYAPSGPLWPREQSASRASRLLLCCCCMSRALDESHGILIKHLSRSRQLPTKVKRQQLVHNEK